MIRFKKTMEIFTLVTMGLILLTSLAYARPVFEKGDAIYRRLDIPLLGFLGHAGLYWEWEDLNEEGMPNNPDDLKTHKVIEALKEAEEDEEGEGGVTLDNNFDQFYHATEFWSVRTHPDLTADQRQTIIETAIQQDDCVYNFFWGYKNPTGMTHPLFPWKQIPPSFRCDGLVEYCYQQAGVDLVPYDIWGPPKTFIWQQILTPWTQMHSSKFEIRDKAEVKEIRLEPSEEGTLKAYVSDGYKGSGITMVEFWDGEPDDTPDEEPGVRLDQGWDAHDENVGGYYTIDYSGTVTQLYAKAFDQAGNTKVTGVIEDTYVTSQRPDLNYWQHYELIAYHMDPSGWDGGHADAAIYIKAPEPGYDLLHLWIEMVGWGIPEDQGVTTITLYAVDPDSYDTSRITWNTQPPDGKVLYFRNFHSGFEVADLECKWLVLPIYGERAVVIRLTLLSETGTGWVYIRAFSDEVKFFGSEYWGMRPYLSRVPQ